MPAGYSAKTMEGAILAPGQRRSTWAAAFTVSCLALACGIGDDEAPPAGREALQSVSLVGEEIDDAEAERLMALGYVETVPEGEGDEPDGARTLDASRVQPGLDFYVNAHLCSADLIDAEGELLRSWRHEPCLKWGNAVLTQDGEVVVIHCRPGDTAEESFRACRVLKLGWDGEQLWSADVPAHHDLDLLPDGRVAVLTYRHRLIPRIDPTIPVRDHYVAMLSAEGELLEEVSISEILEASPDVFRFRSRRPREHEGSLEIDSIHSNSIEWMRSDSLARQNPLYATTNFLLCSRNQNALIIIDWSSKRAVWSWGQGTLSGPHDATVLPSGNILVFDNGLNRRYSRVLEVDPRTDEVVWSYSATEPRSFFSSHRGAAQRLVNGNTLITDSAGGRAFEVTAEGQVVWSYLNPNRSEAGDRVVIVRMRRVRQLDAEAPEFAWSD